MVFFLSFLYDGNDFVVIDIFCRDYLTNESVFGEVFCGGGIGFERYWFVCGGCVCLNDCISCCRICLSKCV